MDQNMPKFAVSEDIMRAAYSRMPCCDMIEEHHEAFSGILFIYHLLREGRVYIVSTSMGGVF